MTDLREYLQMYLTDLQNFLADHAQASDEELLAAAREAFTNQDPRYLVMANAINAMKKGGFGRYKTKGPGNQPVDKYPPPQTKDDE